MHTNRHLYTDTHTQEISGFLSEYLFHSLHVQVIKTAIFRHVNTSEFRTQWEKQALYGSDSIRRGGENRGPSYIGGISFLPLPKARCRGKLSTHEIHQSEPIVIKTTFTPKSLAPMGCGSELLCFDLRASFRSECHISCRTTGCYDHSFPPMLYLYKIDLNKFNMVFSFPII